MFSAAHKISIVIDIQDVQIICVIMHWIITADLVVQMCCTDVLYRCVVQMCCTDVLYRCVV